MIYFYLWIATQIITESFPISSSTHARLVALIFHHYHLSSFLEYVPRYFDDILYLPTLAIYSVMFFDRYSTLLFYVVRCWRIIARLVLRTGVSVVVTMLFYFLFELIDTSFMHPVFGIVVTMLLLFSLRFTARQDYVSPTFFTASILGLVQGVALLPGFSRLGLTYAIARWLRLSPRTAFELSVSIQVPLILPLLVRGFLVTIRSPHASQLLNVKVALVMLISSGIAYWGLLITRFLAYRYRLWLVSLYLIIPIVLYCILNAT